MWYTESFSTRPDCTLPTNTTLDACAPPTICDATSPFDSVNGCPDRCTFPALDQTSCSCAYQLTDPYSPWGMTCGSDMNFLLWDTTPVAGGICRYHLTTTKSFWCVLLV